MTPFRQFAEADPYVLEGIVTSWTVREWSVVVGALVEALPNFVASYAWQQVPINSELPSGLDVELSLDGDGLRRARIPPTWRLQVTHKRST